MVRADPKFRRNVVRVEWRKVWAIKRFVTLECGHELTGRYRETVKRAYCPQCAHVARTLGRSK